VKFRDDIDVSRLREIFDLDEDLGILKWRTRPVKTRSDKTWNTRFAGTVAGTLTCGYRQVVIDYRFYKVHRVIFAMTHGRWPEGEVDHKERDGLNNRAPMLRDATHAENQRNSKMRSNNRSGVKGVCWDARRQKWMAYIDADKRIYLGRFDQKAAATAVADAARDEYHAEFARRA